MLNPGAPSPFVLVGDHAGREVPRALDGLGVDPAEMDRHIAWDIGVAGLGRKLSMLLGAAYVRQRYSRLVIDCNRDAARPDAIPEVSDGTEIPANRGLTEAQRAARVQAIFQPYHAAIADQLDGRGDQPTYLVALHSFTPAMGGKARPWRFGVLHMEDSPLSTAVLARLRAEPFAGEVGDNEPYRMDGTDFTVPHHAHSRGLDYVELEVRQDLLADEAGQNEIARMLAKILPLALEELQTARR